MEKAKFTEHQYYLMYTAINAQVNQICENACDFDSVPEDLMEQYNFGEICAYDLCEMGFAKNDARYRKQFYHKVKVELIPLAKKIFAEISEDGITIKDGIL